MSFAYDVAGTATVVCGPLPLQYNRTVALVQFRHPCGLGLVGLTVFLPCVCMMRCLPDVVCVLAMGRRDSAADGCMR